MTVFGFAAKVGSDVGRRSVLVQVADARYARDELVVGVADCHLALRDVAAVKPAFSMHGIETSVQGASGA